MYLYRAKILKNTDEYIMSQAEKNQHASDRTDFETNFKAQTIPVGDVIIAETTFVADLTYIQFKAKIVSPVLWSDVKYIDGTLQYILHVASQNPL